jgi:NADH-quinone oxidoreductase subunit L
MVSAGVYLIIRTFPLMQAVPQGPALHFIAFIGTFTALFAATIAVAQNDIKKVLAYSTISQLGFMFAALGIGAYVAAAFHLLMHAFFKALLFLGSGSVIHGMEHGHHEAAHAHSPEVAHAHEVSAATASAVHADSHTAETSPREEHGFDPQDMRNMGGLFRKMPKTAWTFIIGGLALSGFPFVTAGFWSKDEILADAWAHEHQLVFAVLAIAALLTAFYTGRQIMMTFFGKARTEAANHASERDSIFLWMTIPLIILGVFAVMAGWVGIPTTFPALGALSSNPFHEYIGGLAEAIEVEAAELPFMVPPLLTSLVVALGGLLLGYLVYRGYAARAESETPDPLARPLGRIYRILANKYYVDELYFKVFVKGSQRLANWLYKVDDLWVIDPIVDGVGKVARRLSEVGHWIDINIVDRAVNGVGAIAAALGSALRTIQTGKAQNYLFTLLLVLSVALGVFLLLPR